MQGTINSPWQLTLVVATVLLVGRIRPANACAGSRLGGANPLTTDANLHLAVVHIASHAHQHTAFYNSLVHSSHVLRRAYQSPDPQQSSYVPNVFY
jgi:hypothetical protein